MKRQLEEYEDNNGGISYHLSLELFTRNLFTGFLYGKEKCRHFQVLVCIFQSSQFYYQQPPPRAQTRRNEPWLFWCWAGGRSISHQDGGLWRGHSPPRDPPERFEHFHWRGGRGSSSSINASAFSGSERKRTHM